MPRLRTPCSIVVSLLFGLVLFKPVQSAQTSEAAGSAVTAGANGNPILVELFTSEGCSSCPPADDFVQKLDTVQPVPGAQIIVLSEHVDYWDHDGWKDPNSSHALTERQSDYVRALRLSTAYTPQIIVDGAREMKIGDAQGAEDVFQQAVAAPKIPMHISGVTVQQGNPNILRAQVQAESTRGQSNADVFLAIALDHVDSQVLRGENGGRHLTHVAVVQQIAKIGKLNREKNFAEDVQLKLKAATALDNLRIVAFVQEPGPGKLLGATLWKGAR